MATWNCERRYALFAEKNTQTTIMALTGASRGHVHAYLVSIKLDPSFYAKGLNVASRIHHIKVQLQYAQKYFPHIRKFKVCGELLMLTIFDVPVEKIKQFDVIIASFGPYGGLSLNCEVLTSYEKFADETLGMPETLTKRESDNYIAGLSPLLWCQYTLNFTGKSDEAIREVWKKQATVFLEARKHKSVKFETYKVVGFPKVHAFVSMTPQEWDKFAFNLPANENNTGALAGEVRAVHDLDQWGITEYEF